MTTFGGAAFLSAGEDSPCRSMGRLRSFPYRRGRPSSTIYVTCVRLSSAEDAEVKVKTARHQVKTATLSNFTSLAAPPQPATLAFPFTMSKNLQSEEIPKRISTTFSITCAASDSFIAVFGDNHPPIESELGVSIRKRTMRTGGAVVVRTGLGPASACSN
eukprot:jgi/Tetstr1/427267/TSEL_017452.t1